MAFGKMMMLLSIVALVFMLRLKDPLEQGAFAASGFLAQPRPDNLTFHSLDEISAQISLLHSKFDSMKAAGLPPAPVTPSSGSSCNTAADIYSELFQFGQYSPLEPHKTFTPKGSQEFREKLFGGRNIYNSINGRNVNGLEVAGKPIVPDPWTLTTSTIAKVVDLVDRQFPSVPKVFVEIGAWTGGSAIHVAQELSKSGGFIISIDTWLGDHRFYDRPDIWEEVGFTSAFAYPLGLATFIYNIKQAGMENHVVPFPQVSTVAAKILYKAGFRAHAIYVDASHEYFDAKQDLEFFWHLLMPNGIMYGDDYNWVGVKQAVDEFVNCHPEVRLHVMPCVAEFGAPCTGNGKLEWVLLHQHQSIS